MLQEFAAFYDAISKIGFPGVLLIILYGSYKGMWYWSRHVDECNTRWKERLEESQKREAEWKAEYFRVANQSDEMVRLMKKTP